MAKKIKNLRTFTFKAYIVNNGEEVQKDAHKGEFMFKSDCHYYVEKHILDFINANVEKVQKEPKKYVIYKISTIEDSKIKDLLIEQIFIKDDRIVID